jgi:hypothetical protein
MTTKLPKIIYVGSDLGYWKTLRSKFGHIYEALPFEFLDIYKTSEHDVQLLIGAIRSHKPKIIFVDFSQSIEQMLHIVRVLSRLNRVDKPFVIGLVDQNQDFHHSQRAILAGVTCVHIKSIELSSLVYNAIAYTYPDKLIPHGFATAKLSDEIAGRIPCMVSIVSKEGIRIESDLNLSIGGTYSIHTHWSNKGIIKSTLADCASSTDEDLYYNFKYAQDFGFQFIAPLILDEDLEQEEAERLEKIHEQELAETTTMLNKWIDANADISNPKRLKTLVIDKELIFYAQDKLTDEFPFVLRCQPYLKEPATELKKVMAQLIVYNMEDVDPEELEVGADIAYSFNEITNLQNMGGLIKTMSNYEPYIIVFNSGTYDTTRLKTALGYKNILSFKEKMTTELVLKMSDMLKAKLLESAVEYDEGTLFLKKEHPATYAELDIDLKLVAVSENDIYFDTDLDLCERTVLKIKTPVEMYLSIAPAPGQSSFKSKYYAVIHTIGEKQRSELRKFINSVFFREKEIKKAEEKAAVEEQKIQAAKKREEAELKRIADEAAKKAQEANEAQKDSKNVNLPAEDDDEKEEQ